MKQKYEVGEVVLFIKKVSTVDTEVPVGASGVVCDYCDGEMFPYYVTFNNVEKSDWFGEDELVSVGGETNEN